MRLADKLRACADSRCPEGIAKKAATAKAIETALQAVDSLDEDRILRHFVNAVTAAIRTNFYQRGPDGQPKDLIAIKFESRKVDGMPLPRPLYEIFVYSPRVEAVHLRFGKVARGGIRWSDRPQDFRNHHHQFSFGRDRRHHVTNARVERSRQFVDIVLSSLARSSIGISIAVFSTS